MAANEVFRRGLSIAVYAPSKVGKTVCAGGIAAVGLSLATKDALLPWRTFLGISEFREEPTKALLAEATKFARAEGKKFPVVYFDDLTIMVDRSFKGDWNRLGDEILDLTDAAEELNANGTHVLFTAHEVGPKESSGKFVRGGPGLPGQYPEKFTALLSVVLRAVSDETAAPWPYVLWSRPRREWVAGDRVSVFPDGCPMNVAEGLRAAGYIIPRPKGLEWLEDVAERVAGAVTKAGMEQWREVLRGAAAKLAGRPVPHVRWALSDGLHRARFRQAQASLDEWLKEPDITRIPF